MRGYRVHIALVVAAAFALLVSGNPAWAKRPSVKSHMDKITNEEGCAACHAGAGTYGTPLLKGSINNLCFSCHGARDKKKSRIDIQSVLGRSSVHPIEKTTIYHRFGEKLPEEDPSAARHVTCVDCHVVHISTEDKPTEGGSGYDPGDSRKYSKGSKLLGARKKKAEFDYQICYKCHADSANMPTTSRNISMEFDPDNMSYHPVEAAGKNSKVPSLISSLSETDTITCTDCHGNDDAFGAKGPHGSDSSPLLVARYQTGDGPEGERTYELCYMCHSRKSILGDRSFKRHNYHVVLKKTSCYTCHASHGTEQYKDLISFNPDVVTASINSSGPFYYESGTGMPKCYLYCHGTDHWSGGIGNSAWP